VGCFLIGKQKVVLFLTFKENEEKAKETARNALVPWSLSGKLWQEPQTLSGEELVAISLVLLVLDWKKLTLNL
jgi:ABC-type uncharacterized transport system YnjBCD ATPase subunit